MDMNVLIEQVRQLKPNSYPEEMLKSWALELEARVQQEVYQNYEMPEREAAGLETDGYWVEDGVADELTIPFPHDRLYVEWLCAKIDFYNGEYDRYNNEMTLFNSEMENFCQWFTRTHRHKPVNLMM